MKHRSMILVWFAFFASFAIAHVAASHAADLPAEPKTASVPQRFVIFEAFMRGT